MEDEAAKEDFEALDDIEDIETPGEGGGDVIDEAAAAQMLKVKNKRKKSIGKFEIEETVALIARIPPKNVSC